MVRMKKSKVNTGSAVSVLGFLLVIAAVVGYVLLKDYAWNDGGTEDTKQPEAPYSIPSDPQIPDLFAGGDTDGQTDTQPAAEEPSEEASAEDDDRLPREKYGLPYPQKERPEEIAAFAVQETAKAGYEYFDNSVFIGDSVMLGLKYYTTQQRGKNSYFLGNAKFIAVGSYSVADALTPLTYDSVPHPLYNGAYMQPQDIILDMGVKRVFIMLGLNDVGIYSKTTYLNNYLQLINRIRMNVPDIQIVLLPVTPMTVEGERKILYNAKIDEYDNALAQFASENGCYFVDVASSLKDEEGYLPKELSSDNYCHLQPEAYDMWIEYMLTHCIPSPEEEKALLEANGGAIHINMGIPEVEGWEGDAGKA